MSTKLSNFTDVLGDADEIGDSQVSQPLSLPSSSENRIQIIQECTRTSKPMRPAKGTGQYNELRSVEEIDPKYRDVFVYQYFNLIQSRVIEDVLYSDKSMVVCAPTGSGKTVIFEMAIVQLLMEMEDKNYNEDYKIIYMAPVKALCTERLTEWYSKFTKLGLMCIEVTGDTDVDLMQLQAYKIIITTPEKWDMLTRRWRDHRGLVEMIKLFLIDEVHILNDEIRGPVLEAVVSRMKTIQASAQSAYRIEKLKKQYDSVDKDVVNLTESEDSPPRIRFIAVSATVSNPEDVAAWLGTADKPAVYYKFGDECRPVKLKRVVEGYPCSDGTSIFKFDIILNYKLWPIIQRYHDGKPTLIFCNTRKSVLLTAETLSREITITFSAEQQNKLTALASTIKNKKLQSLVLGGVGCHHAGILYEERTSIERAFRNGDLPILITTTTLAMGVNLPAHLVIIKNTQQYVNGAYQEYSISTVLQMVGRAGRPQYDTDATAVIMTRQKDKARYQALAGGNEPLQSYLHKRLAENLNSETALGTVGDVAQCVEWLRSTFLYVRAAKDPKRYLGLTAAAPEHLILKKIEELCVIAMNGLSSAGLITMDEASCITSTDAGQLMSRYYLDLETMKHLMKIQGDETLERLVMIICESHELSDMHLRTDERRTLNVLNRNKNTLTIRFPMKGKITTKQMKLSCLIQAVLGCLPIADPSLNQEAMKIMRIADRICKCLVAYIASPEKIASMQNQCFAAVLNSVILAKCIAAHLWENSPYVSRQLKGIGPTFSTLLATAGKVNFMILEESHPRDLERIMNKGPPAGNVLRKQISLLPKYQLTPTPIDENTVSVKLLLLNKAFLSENIEHLTAGTNHTSFVIAGDSTNLILMLKRFTEKDLIGVYDGCMEYEITRKHASEHKIYVHCISSKYVGLDVHCEFTFKTLISAIPRDATVLSEYYCGNSNDKLTRNTVSPTNTITDRKRRNLNEEIVESKEKKKRDNTFSEKIQLLKESFGRTSNNLRKDLEKAKEVSNNVICDLTQPKKSTNNLELDMSNEVNVDLDQIPISIDLTDFENENIDDIMDDSSINRILNEIESEITKTKTTQLQDANLKNEELTTFNLSNFHQDKTHIAVDSHDIPSKPRFDRKSSSKHLKSKSNYNYLEKFEKNNMILIDEEETVQEESGFSKTIKTHVEKYFLNSNKAPDLLDLTLINLCDKSQGQKYTTGMVEVNKVTCEENVSNQQSNLRKFDDDKIELEDKLYTNKSIEVPHQFVHNIRQENRKNSYDTDAIIHFEDIANTESHLKTLCNNTQVKNNNMYEQSCSTYQFQSNIHQGEFKHYSNCNYEEKITNKSHNLNTLLAPNDKSTIVELPNTVSSPNYVTKEAALPAINLLSFAESKLLPTTILTPNPKDRIISNQDKSVAPPWPEKQDSPAINKNRKLQLVPALKMSTSNISTYIKLPSCKDYNRTFSSLAPCVVSDTFTEIVPRTNLAQEIPSACYANKNTMEVLPIEYHIRERPSDIEYNRAWVNRSINKTCPNETDIITAINDENRSYRSQCNNNKTWYSSHESEFINNERQEQEDKYFYSKEKVDIHTKINDDHKIQFIRRLKVDLDIRKIVTKLENKDTANVQNKDFSPMKQANVNFESCSIDRLQIEDNNTLVENNNTILEDTTERGEANSALNEIDLKEDSFRSEKTEEYKEQKISPENKNNIANILQKYSKIIGKSQTCDAKPPSDLTANEPSTKQNRTKIKPCKPVRPFKITDIQRLNLPLPPIYDAIKLTPCEETSTLPENTLPTFSSDNKSNITPTQFKKESEEYTVEHSNLYSELTPCHSPTAMLEQSLEIGEEHFKIDQAMFNPKTLLQSVNNDDDEIIPPPPEFETNLTFDSYSPEYKLNNLNSNIHFGLNTSLYPKEEQEYTKFANNSLFSISQNPSKEIETHNICDEITFEQRTPAHFCAEKRNNTVNKNNFQCQSPNSNKIISQPGRLTAFKFNRKTKLKM